MSAGVQAIATTSTLLEGGAIMLGTALVFVTLFRKLGLGATLGYIVGGILIGPHLLGLVGDPEQLASISEIGIALLLFLVGLELQPSRLWRLRKDIFGLGLAQVVLCGLALSLLIYFALDFSPEASLAIGLPLGLSSTAQVLPMLRADRELNTPQGERAFSILLFQDLAIVPMITIIAAMRRMATPLASRWAHIGLRNALLARAPSPGDVHPADWAAERAWLLLRMGEADAAQLLIASVDSDRFTPKMNQVALQSALASSDPSAMIVDDDPAQGVIDGRIFTHPDLHLTFAVPAGFLMQNSTRRVSIQGSAGQAEFRGGQFNGSMEDYVSRVLQGLTEGRVQLQLGPMQRTTVNGIPAAYVVGRANTSSGGLDVGVFAYQWDQNTIYHFLTLTRAGQGLAPFASMVDSFRRISPAEAAAIRPRVIDIVTVGRGDTIQSLGNRMAYRDFRVDRFLALNGLAANSPLVPGQKVKLVVYGTRRA